MTNEAYIKQFEEDLVKRLDMLEAFYQTIMENHGKVKIYRSG